MVAIGDVHRVQAGVVIALALVLSGGCGLIPALDRDEPPEELPDEPSLEMRQALDVCALVTGSPRPDEVPPSVLDEAMISGPLGGCSFDLGGFGGAVWLNLAERRADLPEDVLAPTEEDAWRQVAGGHLVPAPSPPGEERNYLVSHHTGLVFVLTSVHRRDRSAAEAEVAQAIGEVALSALAEEPSRIDWPDGGTARVDLCSFAAEQGFFEELGADPADVWSADHRHCTNGADETGSDVAASVSLSAGSQVGASRGGAAGEVVQVAGKPAVLSESDRSCEVSVVLGSDQVLREHGRPDVVHHLSAVRGSGGGCDDLLAAVEHLVTDWPG